METIDPRTSTQLKVQGMDCPDCADKVERGLRRIEGVGDVRSSLMGRTVTVTHTGVDRGLLVAAIDAAGYAVEPEGRKAAFSVPDMECADCAARVERSVRGLAGVSDVIMKGYRSRASCTKG